ncbi:Beta-1 [Ranunculus cassubicifolius]
MSFKSRGGGGGSVELPSKNVVSRKWSFLLCIACFCAGMLFTSRMWTVPETKDLTRTTPSDGKLSLVLDGCDPSIKDVKREQTDVLGEVSKTHNAIQTLDKTISNLEMELAAARATHESILNGAPISENLKETEPPKRRKYLMVVGINTAFSSRKRRDSVRATWLPQGEKRKRLEEEKGIVARFVIGHSATSGGILDRAIEAEDRKHGDFLRLDHVEGYLELSAKTKIYFATAVAMWDADFYVKVDDDVHVNIATLGSTLARHIAKPRVYIGCMKSGPVLAQKGVRYHEPEYWKFGEEGNKYFRHATGQLYAISHDLATYVAINQHVLHKYANEDVSLGAWFIGLDVVHIDDRRLCCGTPPDCEWKAQAGNVCVASFDWSCSGICKSAERIKEVHRRCGEGDNAVWTATF